MNKQEATRYAHKIVADTVRRVIIEIAASDRSPDAPHIIRALGHIQESHARTGPRADDRPPRQPEYTGEKFSFDQPEPNSSVAESVRMAAESARQNMRESS